MRSTDSGIRCSLRAGYPALLLQDPRTGAYAEVLPTLGGTVSRLVLFRGNQAVPVLAPDRDGDLARNPLYRGRILFPFNDRIPGGSYSFGGQRYNLPLNDGESGSAIHGFLAGQEMRLLRASVEEHSSRIRLGWRFSEHSFPGYPFALSIELEYRIGGEGFSLSFLIRNEGGGPAPCTFGWHPYFSLGQPLEDTVLEADFRGRWEIDEQALPVGNAVPVEEGSRFDFTRGSSPAGSGLDHPFLAPEDGRISIRAGDLRLVLRQDRQVFRFSQLFVPPDGASVAVEPITSAADAFNHPERGLLVIAPGEEIAASVRLSLE